MYGNDSRLDNRCVKSAIVAFFLLGAAFLLIPDKQASAATPLSLIVSDNSTYTLTAAQSPYIVNYLIVDEGSSLIIDPDVILKLYRTTININGNLYINGTSEAPVYITSYKDDSVGGDTNSDGGSTLPAAGDWLGLMIAENQSNGSASINHAIVKYGGYGNCAGCMFSNIYVGGGTVAINNSQVSYSETYGIRQRSGFLSVNSSELDHNQYGLVVDSYLFYPDTVVENSNIHDNFRGIMVSTFGGSMTANDNIFTANDHAFDIGAYTYFVHEGNVATGNGLNGFYLSGTFIQDQVWNADLPYMIGGFTVPSGVILTIDPGAIIKSKPESSIVVHGSLLVNGTAENPVYFTSYADDSIGGDSNGDGLSAGIVGSWDGMAIGVNNNNPEVSLNHAIIRYGGKDYCSSSNCYFSSVFVNTGDVSIIGSEISYSPAYGIKQAGGNLVIDSTKIANSYIGFYTYNGTASVEGSSIYGNSNAAMINNGANQVDADGNWWGSASGPYNPNSNPSGTGGAVWGNVSFSPWLSSDPL